MLQEKMMTVMFNYSLDSDKVMSVYWMDDGRVTERSLAADGTIKDRDYEEFSSLREAFDGLSGTYYPMSARKVDDVRSAFKYLGKSVDLIETLPKGDLDEQEQATGGAV